MVREFMAVMVRASMQWALASLLLANGAVFCLIAAAASWLRLGPPCILCARVHRLLGSLDDASSSCVVAGGEEHGALRRLLCDTHAAAIAGAAAPELVEHRKGQMCSACDDVVKEKKDGLEAENSDKLGGLETHRVVSIGSEICEQDQAGDHRRRATDGSNAIARDGAIDNSDGDDGPYVSLFELAPISAPPQRNDNRNDHVLQELDGTPEPHREDGAREEERLAVRRLVDELHAKRRELDELREELERERRAGAEAAEYQRQLEEQGEFDREAVRLAMQLVHETETEKHSLQRQLEASSVKAQLYEYEVATTMDTSSPPVSRFDAAAGHGEDGSNNNYQSLVDFLPGSVYSSSPDLANLLKLYTEGNGGGRRQRDGLTSDVPAVVAEEVEVEEKEEEEEVAVMVIGVPDSNGNGDAVTIAGDLLQQRDSNHGELTPAAQLP